MLLHGQMGQELVHFRFGHLRGVPDVVKEDVSFDPIAIGLLGPSAVMARSQGLPQLIKQLWFRAILINRRVYTILHLERIFRLMAICGAFVRSFQPSAFETSDETQNSVDLSYQ